MLSKFIKVVMLTVLALTFSTVYTAEADAGAVMWGKTELKLGQVGKVTVLSNSSLVKLENDGSLTNVRALKKGEEFRVYSYKSNHGGLYGVGGGSFIQNNSTVKYETPSKSKLALLKNQGAVDSITGETFNMSISQVEKSESAKLLQKAKENNITALIYEKGKYGYHATLSYYFVDGKMEFIEYDFLPGEEIYSTSSEMSLFHDRLHRKAESELGKDYIFTNDVYTFRTMWYKDSYIALLSVDDKEIYTSAKLTYSPK